MPRIVYTKNKDGTITKTEVPRVPYTGTPAVALMSHHDRILYGYAASEANGEPWRQPYSKTFVRDLHKRGAEQERRTSITH